MKRFEQIGQAAIIMENLLELLRLNENTEAHIENKWFNHTGLKRAKERVAQRKAKILEGLEEIRELVNAEVEDET